MQYKNRYQNHMNSGLYILGYFSDIYLPNSNGKCVDMLFDGLNEDGSPKDLVEGDPYLLASFDFDVRLNKADWYYKVLPLYDYLEPSKFIPMVEDVLDMKVNNVGEVMMKDVRNIFDYLVEKLRSCMTIREYRQVTDTYNKLFLVDPVRDWYDETVFNPEETNDFCFFVFENFVKASVIA